jgi:hypothetical protein
MELVVVRMLLPDLTLASFDDDACMDILLCLHNLQISASCPFFSIYRVHSEQFILRYRWF